MVFPSMSLIPGYEPGREDHELDPRLIRKFLSFHMSIKPLLYIQTFSFSSALFITHKCTQMLYISNVCSTIEDVPVLVYSCMRDLQLVSCNPKQVPQSLSQTSSGAKTGVQNWGVFINIHNDPSRKMQVQYITVLHVQTVFVVDVCPYTIML